MDNILSKSKFMFYCNAKGAFEFHQSYNIPDN